MFLVFFKEKKTNYKYTCNDSTVCLKNTHTHTHTHKQKWKDSTLNDIDPALVHQYVRDSDNNEWGLEMAAAINFNDNNNNHNNNHGNYTQNEMTHNNIENNSINPMSGIMDNIDMRLSMPDIDSFAQQTKYQSQQKMIDAANNINNTNNTNITATPQLIQQTGAHNSFKLAPQPTPILSGGMNVGMGVGSFSPNTENLKNQLKITGNRTIVSPDSKLTNTKTHMTVISVLNDDSITQTTHEIPKQQLNYNNYNNNDTSYIHYLFIFLFCV